MKFARTGLSSFRCGTALYPLALAALVGMSTGAFAQDTSAAPGTAATPPTGPIESQASSSSTAPADTGTIIVTGSRIASPNLTSTSPVTVLSAQEVALTGTTRIEDIVNSLPQAFVSQSSGVSNGADGTATVNLRNLGDTRTLVLVNGLRLPPGDPSRIAGSLLGSASDINNVPAGLVKRVDVLTGGASAAYGADAVAGVVNFVLDDTFEGVKFNVTGGIFQHNNNNADVQSIIRSDPRYGSTTNPLSVPRGQTVNGGTYDVSGMLGGKFGSEGQGHVTVFASYHHQAPVLQSSRDFSTCAFGSNELDGGPGAPSASRRGDYYCAGSSNTAQTSLLINGGVGGGLGTSAGSRLIVTPGGGLRAYSGATDAYNYNPTNYFQRPDTRYNVGAFANYEINEHFKPYVNFLFMDDRSLAQIAPSGTFNNVFTINCSNSLLTVTQRSTLGCTAPSATSTQTVAAALAKRNVEGGARVDDLRHTDYRIVGGMKGEINEAFSYDAHYQYGTTIYNENYLNDFSRSRVQSALNNCQNPGGTSIGDATCAPYNIFTGTTTIQPTSATGVTTAALNYVQSPGFRSGYTREIVAGGTIQGDLGVYGIKSPFADNGVTVAFGPEYRKESLRLNSDVEFSTGDLLGQGAQVKSTSGSFDVKEGFIEVNAPLASNKPLFQQLLLNGAYRYSDYSTVGHTNTWKASFEWSPFQGEFEGAIRFRGSINRAVRAPTLQDFYSPSQLSLGGSIDPCAQRTAGRAASTSLATCLRSAQGDPNFATQYAGGLGIARNPASQYNQLTAGAATVGSSLRPEVAITKTIGAIFQPRQLRGFVMSVDYYNIRLRDRIATDGYNVILNQCLATGSAYYCGLVHRDPANGSLWLTPNGYIYNPVYNAGRLRTSGIDISASYTNKFDHIGRISLSFQGTYLLTEKFEVTLHNADGSLSSNGFYNCVGFYGDNCGVPSPKWRHQARLTWSPIDAFSLSVKWRHIGSSYSEYANNDQALDGSGALIGGYTKADVANSRIKAFNYVDVAVSFDITKNLQLRAGVNNVTDRDPALIPGAEYAAGNNNGNTYPGYYDALGRYFFGGLTVLF